MKFRSKYLFQILLLITTSTVMADVTLRFSWWGMPARNEATLQAIRLFEIANPGIRVRPEVMDFQGYYERLEDRIRKKSEPDIMQINWAWISALSPGGDRFYDMNQIKEVFQLETGFPGAEYKSGMVNGKLNALPVSQAARFFVWQKPVFDRAGIALPRTWDDLFAVGRSFERKLGKDYFPLQGETYALAMLAHTYVHQKSGKPYIFPNQSKVAFTLEEAQAWVHFYRRLFNEHVVPSPETMLSGGSVAIFEAWREGRWAGVYTWDSMFDPLQVALPEGGKLVVGEHLMAPDAKRSGIFSRPSMMFAIGKHSKHPQIAARLIHFLQTDPAAVRVLGLHRGMPLNQTAYKILQKDGRYTAKEAKVREILASNQIDFPSPYREHPKIVALIREVFEAVSFNRITEKEAALRLVTEGNKILKEIRWNG